jgi:phage gp36-like protein
MSNPLDLILHATAAETASGVTAATDIGPRNALRLTLEASAFVGTGAKLTVDIETSPNGTSGWKRIGALPALTVETTAEETFGSVLRYVRFRWALDGTTPSVAFGLTGSAHVTYANLRDIDRLGMAKAALAAVPVSDKIEALIAASDISDRYLCREFTLPLVKWPSDLRRFVVHIAVYDLMCVRGFQPEGADALIVKRYDDAIAQLREIGDGKACMPGIEDSDDGDSSSSSDGDYDVAELSPGVFFGAYPFGEEVDLTGLDT